MKQLYILMILLCFSCAEKIKEKQETDIGSALDTIQQALESPTVLVDGVIDNTVEFTNEDISGEYELIQGKTHIIDDETIETFKAAIVIEQLSDTDFGFYAADKVKDISPIGDFGVLRLIKNEFHKLDICDGEDIDGNDEGNFTKGLYLYNRVFVYRKGDSLGIVQYGSNFRKYRLYKKKKTKLHTSLVKTMKDTRQVYKEFLAAYEIAKDYDATKLKVTHYLNGDVWQTKHVHNEDYASFDKTYYYQNSNQDGKFIKQDTIFEGQFKNQVENATFENETLENLNFEDVIQAIDTRPLPQIDNTNFDDFHESEDYKTVEAKVLKLEKVYPGFNELASGFRAIRSYKIVLSKEFYTVVATILENEHEMESVLINYDLNGKIIDSKVVSYDEIAEGQSRIESRISKNTITTNHIFWALIKEIEQESFKINKDGTIDKIDTKKLSDSLTNYTLILDILDILEQLKLNSLDIKTDMIVTKTMPENPDETIVVIPEIVEEGEQYFELNTHIVLINNHTGKISHQYFESSKTNHWVSDAVQLKELKIDTAPYIIAENERAFGIRVYHYGSSQVNPYNTETISLFMKSEKTLKKVLNNFDIMTYGGERVTDCNAEVLSSKAILALSAEKTNGYYDIKVKNKITETKSYEDENGVCESTDETTIETSTLKFESKEYKALRNMNKLEKKQ